MSGRGNAKREPTRRPTPATWLGELVLERKHAVGFGAVVVRLRRKTPGAFTSEIEERVVCTAAKDQIHGRPDLVTVDERPRRYKLLGIPGDLDVSETDSTGIRGLVRDVAMLTWTPSRLSVQVARVCRSSLPRQVAATSRGVR
jgi:hypothetical protein